MALDLVALTLRHARTPGMHSTAVSALSIMRADATYARVHSMHKPALCFIVQGTKVVTVGDEVLRYGQNQFLYSSVELPISGEVVEATRKRPYLVLVLEIEPSLVFDLVASNVPASRKASKAQHGIFVGHDAAITEAFTRLLACLSDPSDARLLAPLVIRELVYRILRSPYGDAVRQVGLADSQTQRIAAAIEHLKQEYATSQSMANLARRAGMSVSAFHAHFRKVTTLTPLQYQKQLQLHEARRLLLTSATSAADAGFRVGYESASQFSREYARYFGRPPINDIKHAAVAVTEATNESRVGPRGARADRSVRRA